MYLEGIWSSHAKQHKRKAGMNPERNLGIIKAVQIFQYPQKRRCFLIRLMHEHKRCFHASGDADWYCNQLFENFENWQVSEYIDKMITSSICPSFEEPFNTGLEFGPMLVCPYISGEPQTQFQNLYVYIYNLKQTPLCWFVCWKLTTDHWKNKDERKQRFPTSSPPNLSMQ